MGSSQGYVINNDLDQTFINSYYFLYLYFIRQQNTKIIENSTRMLYKEIYLNVLFLGLIITSLC